MDVFFAFVFLDNLTASPSDEILDDVGGKNCDSFFEFLFAERYNIGSLALKKNFHLSQEKSFRYYFARLYLLIEAWNTLRNAFGDGNYQGRGNLVLESPSFPFILITFKSTWENSHFQIVFCFSSISSHLPNFRKWIPPNSFIFFFSQVVWQKTLTLTEYSQYTVLDNFLQQKFLHSGSVMDRKDFFKLRTTQHM